ncbi:MAG TPA: AbrB/MazE/SpoVT family DNA-binding domain-containing protein [Pyrinomonadaceae bacterium]|jgi:antitoxin MazE|nr:AbrB/MazE/SpoVT family DNA-binding domain-containing protein [Pyrinomonadaceae bacterium]
MRAHIIRIGNSQGIRIPKVLLEESGISGEVDLEISGDGILIRNVSKPRSGWEEMFYSLAEADDDASVSETRSQFDKKDWQW